MLRIARRSEALICHSHQTCSKIFQLHFPVRQEWPFRKALRSFDSFCKHRRKHTLSRLWRQLYGSARHSGQVSSINGNKTQAEDDNDLKSDAKLIFQGAVNSVLPRKMIEKVLHFDKSASRLMVEKKVYILNRNVFVVGFGKAAMGMARAVEDILGEHIVAGVISVPRDLPEEMKNTKKFDYLLSENTKIQTYEGSDKNEVDESAHNAAKAINNLVTRLSAHDIVIVLCSGGGSTLLPSPHPPITLDELQETMRLVSHQGASVKDRSTVRKSIEFLKGGGLVKAAKPAEVLSLILSSIIGDSVSLMVGGPTYPCHPTPRHCLEIITRLGVKDKVPDSVIAHLDKMILQVDLEHSSEKNRHIAQKELEDQWKGVQNVIVGNNSVACEAAGNRAKELGYLPLILTKEIHGEAHKIGALCARLAKFILVCCDRKATLENSSTIAQLELDLVESGMKKLWINSILALTKEAFHIGKDLCLIFGGELVVHVNGKGVGGKNMECALGALSQMKMDFQGADAMKSQTDIAILSADTDGHEGSTKLAGAVVDNNFVNDVVKHDYDIEHFLRNNDSLTFFQTANKGRNLIDTKLTGTNVMDMVILLVKRPEDYIMAENRFKGQRFAQ